MKLINIILGELFRPFLKVDGFDLPKRYHNLKLVTTLKNFGACKIGIYQDSKRKKYIVKYWKGLIKNVDYYMLKHEITALKILQIANKRLKQSGKYKFKFPEHISHLEYKSSLLVCSTFENGITLQNKSYKIQENIHQLSLVHIKRIYRNLTESEKKLLGKKDWFVITYQFPMLLSAALIRQKWLIKYVHRLLMIFIGGVYDLKKFSDSVLVHGDLHGKNILVNRNEVTILDVGQMTLTYPEYELLTSLSSPHFAKKFHYKLIKNLHQIAVKSPSNLRRLKLLTIHISVHNLTSDKLTHHVEHHRELIKFALRIQK